VTIQGLTMTASGYTFTIGDVTNLLLSGCNLGNNNIVINAQAVAQGTVSHCTFGQLLRSGAATAKVTLSVTR
jgi:hypothetical protein